MAVLVDTDRVGRSDREEALRQAITHAAGSHDVRFIGPEKNPSARLECWRFTRDVVVMDELTTGVEHLRDERHDRTSAPENVAFVVHGGSPGRYSGAGHDETLFEGGLYVADLSGHFVFRRSGRGEVRILQIARSALGLTPERVSRAAGALSRSPLYPLFRAQLVGAVSAGASIAGGSAASQVAEAVVALAEALLRTTEDAESGATDFLRERIELFLHDNFHRHDLSPAFIAYAHNISERQLFKVWASQPRSLMETVYWLRLDHGRRLLETGQELSIGAVAVESGFDDASHFSRRFRAAFGLSPGEARRCMRSGAETVR